MYRSFSYVFGLGALLMLAACGDGEKKSETEEQKATSSTEATEKTEQVSEESSDTKKVILINDAVSKSESGDATETQKPTKKSPKKVPKLITNDTDSLVDIIESPIDDIIVDEPTFSPEKAADQGQNVVENKKSQSDQQQVATSSTEAQSDREKIVTENDGSKVEGRKLDSDNSPVYELNNSNESVAVENSGVSDNAEVFTNSEVPEISEETMEGEFSNAEPSVNESVDVEDFVM
jgi:hypothetical protein